MILLHNLSPNIFFVHSIKDLAEHILQIRVDGDLSFRITPELAEEIDSICTDQAAIRALDRTSEFYILDSAP